MSVGLDFFAGFDPRMSGVFLEEVKESFFSFFTREIDWRVFLSVEVKLDSWVALNFDSCNFVNSRINLGQNNVLIASELSCNGFIDRGKSLAVTTPRSVELNEDISS